MPTPETSNARRSWFRFIALLLVFAAVWVIVKTSKHEDSQNHEVIGSSPNIVDPDTIPAGAKIESEPSNAPDPTVQTDGYHDSDEVMEPYKLSKNPYQWRGHSGVLEMRMRMITATGENVGLVPLAGLKFRRMISEHVAIYEVLVSNQETGDELAVILPNSEPPDIARPWRIFVDGPMSAISGYGASLTITSIKFEGYYEPPKAAAPVE